MPKLTYHLFSEICKFHKNYYIADADSIRIRNMDTKENCAINVHKMYEGAMGAQWYENNYCNAKFGGKFSRIDVY